MLGKSNLEPEDRLKRFWAGFFVLLKYGMFVIIPLILWGIFVNADVWGAFCVAFPFFFMACVFKGIHDAAGENTWWWY